MIGAGFSGDAEAIAAACAERNVCLAVENHPEKTPAELLEKIARGHGAFAATVDTGWWGTHGYDAARAIEELGRQAVHVHLKDVLAEGEPHETCRWGEGIVPIRECVRARAHRIRGRDHDRARARARRPERGPARDAGDARRLAVVKVALVGAGNIAVRYAASIAAEPRLELAGAIDPVPGRAEELVAASGGKAYESLEALLGDDDVDVVVNLTPPSAHAEVTRACLEAHKHVHTEKPLALHAREARELAALAVRNDVRVSCAPATLLGEAQQTAWKVVRDGTLGRVRAVYAEANWGRIETWHPSPETLYEVGPLVDVGIYPLTILTAMFGPARRVSAYATTLQSERVRKDGQRFTLPTPDLYVAAIELESGVVVRLTATYWVGPGKQRGIEFHGETASLWMPTWAESDCVSS